MRITTHSTFKTLGLIPKEEKEEKTIDQEQTTEFKKPVYKIIALQKEEEILEEE